MNTLSKQTTVDCKHRDAFWQRGVFNKHFHTPIGSEMNRINIFYYEILVSVISLAFFFILYAKLLNLLASLSLGRNIYSTFSQ